MTDGVRAVGLAVVIAFATVAGIPISDVTDAAGEESCQTVSAPETITESGCYVLSGPTTVSSGDGITINASDVVLDGRGHTLSGTVLGDGVVVRGVAATLTNVTVRNLTLTGWRRGVHYERVDGGRVANVTVRDSQGGIVLRSDSYDWGTNNSQVTRRVVVTYSNVSNNNVGVLVKHSDDGEIRNTVADGNSIHGIQLQKTRDTVVSNVTATANAENGIEVGDSTDATVVNNTATRNGEEGIWLGGSSDTTVENNLAEANDFGIHLGNADGNTVRGNELLANREGGLNVFDSGNNVIYDNHFNNTNNVRFRPSIRTNTWNSSETTGTNVLGGATVAGNAWATPDGTGFSQTCADGDGDGVCDSSFVVNGSQVDALPLAIEQPTNDDPTASFTVSPSTPTVGYDVWFDGGATDDADGSVASFAWDFDGDGIPDATGETTTHNFSATGDYDVTLHVTDDAGATDAVTKTVSVLANDPEVAVTPATVDFGTVSLYASSTKPVIVSNDGAEPLLVRRTRIAGADTGAFSVTSGGATYTIPPGDSAAVNVTFAPTAATTQTATLDLGTNDTDESTIGVSITGRGLQPLNDAPVAVPDHFVHRGGEDLVVTTPDLLSNDFDADGDDLSIGTYSTSTNGTLTVDGGNFTYRPDSGFTGTDSFRYRVEDEGGTLSPFATVRVDVLATPYRDPVTAPDTYYTFEDESLSVDDPGILGNDYDPDGGTLDIGVYVQATNGTASLSDGSFVYTPDPGFTGTDEFTYRAMDDNGGLAPLETVTIEVLPDPNRTPVTTPDTYTVVENGSLSVDGPGILGNDYDPEGTDLSTAAYAGATNGTVSTETDGGFTYRPDPGFTGTDSFMYRAEDEDSGLSPFETVTVEVVPPTDSTPVTSADAVTVVEGETLSDAPGVLRNDYHPAGDALSVVTYGAAPNGFVSVNSDGTFSYTPKQGFTGTDEFTYRAEDEDGDISTLETVTVTVRLDSNRTPVTTPDTYTMVENGSLSVDGDGLLTNDYDPEGTNLTIDSWGVAANGFVGVDDDGSFSYTPKNGFTGTDEFVYRAADEDGGVTTTETVTVEVRPNGAPVARPDEYVTAVGQTLTVAAPGTLLNDADFGGDALSATIVADPSNDTLTAAKNGQFTYAPDPGFVGVDSFTYRVADDRGATTAPTTVTVTVVDPSGQSDAATSRDRVDFGAVESGSTDATAVSVTNVGGADLAISDVRIDGPDADAFAVVAGGTATSLSTAESHTVVVRAAPTGAGDRTARLVLSTTDADRRIVWIPLTATGEAGEDGGGTDPGGESGGSSSSDGDDGSTDSGTDGTDSDRSSVTVRRNGDWTNVSVDGSNRNGPVNVTFDDGDRTTDDAGNDSDARLLGVNVTTDVDRSMTFNVTAEDEPSENTTDFQASVGGEAFGYLRIDHSVPDEDISGVTLKFFVSNDRFSELGVPPDDVTLYRYHDGAWTELPTRPVRNEDDGYVFRADSPGLSTFAIASPPASDAPPAQTDTDSRVTSTPEPTGAATATATTTTAIPTTATTDGTGPGFTAAGLAAVVLALLVYLSLRRRE